MGMQSVLICEALVEKQMYCIIKYMHFLRFLVIF